MNFLLNVIFRIYIIENNVYVLMVNKNILENRKIVLIFNNFLYISILFYRKLYKLVFFGLVIFGEVDFEIF